MSADSSLNEQVAQLSAQTGRRIPFEDQAASLNELIELHEEIVELDPDLARRVRQTFLQILVNLSNASIDDKCSRFLVERLDPEDFDVLAWKNPEQVISFCDLLYSLQFQDEVLLDRVRAYARRLLSQALKRYEEQGEFEKAFRLLHYSPISSTQADPELRRLRNRAYLYEVQRVQRHRRWLYAYLVLNILLVGLVFPLLFINAENGAIQDQIEQSSGVDLPEEERRTFSYLDGVYWSIITAASIGYGDITPTTDVGRIIAVILGVMGVITVGVIAGLILEWISPRHLD